MILHNCSHILILFYLFVRNIYTLLIIVNILNAQSPPSQIATKTLSSKEVVIITGNFSLNGKLTNIAEYDLQEAE